MRIGIPRGLLYYKYLPTWKTFFDQLDVEVVTSPPTTEEMVRIGCARTIGDVCLPVKVFCGHAYALAGKCDYVFIPATHATQLGVYNCPKFIGLPDVVRALVPECPPILDPDIDINKGDKHLFQTFTNMATGLLGRKYDARNALEKANNIQLEYAQLLKTGLSYPQALERMFPDFGGSDTQSVDKPIATVAVIGHPYLVHDPMVNQRLMHHLKNLGVQVLLAETVEDTALRKAMLKLVEHAYWGYEEEVMGAGAYFLESGIDGIISTVAFTCGPDSMMQAILQRAAKRIGKPMLNLVFDEHTAEGGLITRLEAFTDMVQRTRQPVPKQFEIVFNPPQDEKAIGSLGIPNLGLVAPAFRESAKILNVALLVPPVTRNTISLGTRYSPEFACLPFKAILGTFIECLEMGAETLFMVTSSNACRMGYYAKVYEEILLDMGYKFKFLKHPSSQNGITDILKRVKRFTDNASWWKVIEAYRLGTSKLKALDDLERKMERNRPYFIDHGEAERVFHETIRAIDAARTLGQLRQTVRDNNRRLDSIPRDNSVVPLKVGLVGELFVVMEPYVNLNLEAEIGKLGVEVVRNRSTFFSEYMQMASYLNVLNRDKKNLAKYAYPYMRRDVGGHGMESMAEKVHLAQEGFDGLVHVVPFTCMPETIAQNIMPVTEENLPVLTMVCDEQISQTGILTRLEAFVDLLERRRRANHSYSRIGRMNGSLSGH